MSLHEEIIKLRPHLTGIRFHQSFIILDFVIPVHWQVPTKGVPASVQIKGNGLESLKGLNFDIQTNEPFIPTTEVIDEDRTREGNEPSA